jgi:hypothetical protein
MIQFIKKYIVLMLFIITGVITSMSYISGVAESSTPERDIVVSIGVIISTLMMSYVFFREDLF